MGVKWLTKGRAPIKTWALVAGAMLKTVKKSLLARICKVVDPSNLRKTVSTEEEDIQQWRGYMGVLLYDPSLRLLVDAGVPRVS